MKHYIKLIALAIAVFSLLLLISCDGTPAEDTSNEAETEEVLPPEPEISTLPVEVNFNFGRWTADDNIYSVDEETSLNYITTQLFTKNELPEGSFVSVCEGFGLEAVMWSDYPSTSGAQLLKFTDDSINIDADFWQEYTACAFNIFSEDESKNIKEAYNMTSINVPENDYKPFEYNWNDDGVLKILTIGNSFSEDMMEHVYDIAYNLGVEKIELGNLFYPACRLYQHHDFFENNKPVYTYFYNTDGNWQRRDNVTFEAAFETTDWDYISFQESAQEYQSNPDLYTHLPYLIEVAKTRCPAAKLVWHMPWANVHANYQNDKDAMYRDLCRAARTYIEPISDIQMVIPCGTAIENMRTSYASGNGLLLRDGWHLSGDAGRLIAGLTLVKQLTGLDISNFEWSPSVRIKDLIPIMVEAADNAVTNPFTVTQSVYTEAP